jgi:Fe-S cluster assembly protein SufB
MVVEGFIEPFIKELPLEYAVELDGLVKLEMEHPRFNYRGG